MPHSLEVIRRSQLPKALIALFGVLCMQAVSSREVEWQAVNMNTGCVPLDELKATYPQLKGAKTPQQMAAAMRRLHPDAKAVPFLEFSAAMEAADGRAATKREIPKAFSRTNAMMVHWGRRDAFEGFLLYTSELCDALYQQRQ